MKRTLLAGLMWLATLLWATPAAPQSMRLQGNEPLKVAYLLSAIENRYVDTVNMHSFVETAIRNILKELDPHSAYIAREELQRANEPLEGRFDGIGIQFQILDDTLYVVQTISGCPAEKVGMRAGDRIIQVDDTLVAGVGIKNADVVRRLRGKRGSVVKVQVSRAGEEPIDFLITRDRIPIYSMDAAYLIAPGIGYIKINNFGANTHSEFAEGWKRLQKAGAKQLVLDLQGNGGGYLGTAVDLADEFLSQGQTVVYTEGEHVPRHTIEATRNGQLENARLAVVVDEYSASASEIVSGAIQDWDRGVIVGRRTFGKGLVQSQMPLPDGSAVRLTTARYYTPSGRCIQKPYKGVDYARDLEQRFKHGEFMHADSIHFPDSLRFTTLRSHRTVYGGGGIMPDVFVPADTTANTTYQRQLFAKGVINRYCTQYIDTHRAELQRTYPDFDRYLAGFDVTDRMMDDIIAMGEKEGVKLIKDQLERSAEQLKMYVKALIARDLWGTQEYFQVVNQQDRSVLRAVEILQDKKQYEHLLD